MKKKFINIQQYKNIKKKNTASEDALFYFTCIGWSNPVSPTFVEGLIRKKVVDSEEPADSLHSQQRFQTIL